MAGQISIQIVQMRRARRSKTPKKRTASDFLAMLSQVMVNEDEEEAEEQVDQKQTLNEEEIEDLSVDLPALKSEGKTVEFNSWFNENPLTKEDFAKPRPDFAQYTMDSNLVLSTSDTIPESICELNSQLKSKEFECMSDKLAPVVFDYRDLFFAGDDYQRIRKLSVLHAVNHIYNDIACKRQREGNDTRDSNFTPTTVLVLCPYRVQAYQFISEILNCLPDSIEGEAFEVENSDRLNGEYSVAEIPAYLLRSKPKDWLEVFGGNTSSDFKMGIRFFDKKVALFQKMAKSQLIIASPLGLFIQKEKEATDFMSSIELLILDTTDALLMQAWDRLVSFVSQLNQRPSTVEGCDWARVRTYCLQSNHSKMRQTIGYGAVFTPEIHSLFTSFGNKRGSVIVRPLFYPPLLVSGLNRTFRRLATSSPDEIGESLWRCFKDRLFAQVKAWRAAPEAEARRTIIYYVSSMRFYQARKELDLYDVNFLELADEATDGDVKRMKKAFKQDPNAVLIMTERFYYHFRTNLGAERVVFMQPPTFPNFAPELVGTGEALFYFTEFDEMAVERIVGSQTTPRVVASDLYVL